MRELQFTARGMSETDLWRRRIPGQWPTRLAALTALSVAVLYSINRPGQITIAFPDTRLSAHGSSVPVTGTVNNPRVHAVTLHVNGHSQRAAVEDGKFASRVRLHPGGNVIQVSVGSAAASTATAVIYSLDRRSGKDDPPTARIPGTQTTVRGKKVLVLSDDSPSMKDWTETRDQMIRALEVGGIEIQVVEVYTGGVVGMEGEIVRAIQAQLARGEAAFDAVYLFSDFEERGDRQGVGQLRELLIKNRLRLYVGSVEHEPIQELNWLAEDSGGEGVKQTREARE